MNVPSPKSPHVVRLAFLGDVVGKPGLSITCRSVPFLRKRWEIDTIIVNAENAADGAGLTLSQYNKLKGAGIDAITLGDHIYKKKEISSILMSESDIVKPANFPPTAPGKELCIVRTKSGIPVAVMSLLGRVFMRPVDCPFLAIDRVLKMIPDDCKIRFCDVHAEATSDKQTLGRYLDGKVSAVLGTHTHVPTADECILPGGTAFQCDVGMTGPYESILGRAIEPVMNTTVSFDPNSFHVATDDVRISGSCVDVDSQNGKALHIVRFQIKEKELDEFECE